MPTLIVFRSRPVTRESVIKNLHYLEEYGRGIDIVFDAMAQWKLAKPIYRKIL